MVEWPARQGGDPGSISGPGENFSLSSFDFLKITIPYLHHSKCCSKKKQYQKYTFFKIKTIVFAENSYYILLVALAQMVACLPLVQQVRGSIPGGVINFNLKIFNLGGVLD